MIISNKINNNFLKCNIQASVIVSKCLFIIDWLNWDPNKIFTLYLVTYFSTILVQYFYDIDFFFLNWVSCLKDCSIIWICLLLSLGLL